jgi:hypothetical protein
MTTFIVLPLQLAWISKCLVVAARLPRLMHLDTGMRQSGVECFGENSRAISGQTEVLIANRG